MLSNWLKQKTALACRKDLMKLLVYPWILRCMKMNNISIDWEKKEDQIKKKNQFQKKLSSNKFISKKCSYCVWPNYSKHFRFPILRSLNCFISISAVDAIIIYPKWDIIIHWNTKYYIIIIEKEIIPTKDEVIKKLNHSPSANPRSKREII